MAQQIKFYDKSYMDIDFDNISITITDAVATNNGQAFVDYMRNRNNDTAWLTTGSSDAANTQIDIDTTDSNAIDRILLVGHNLKAFTIQYHNGSIYTDFSTPISETTNSDTTTEFIFDEVSFSKLRIIITGTQVTNEDKQIKQMLLCESIGQLEGWPEIKKPIYSINKKQIRLLSGKSHILRQRGAFSCSLEVESYNVTTDLDIMESLFFKLNGVVMWINAGDSTQFSRDHYGYRPEDIFLVKAKNEFSPEFYRFIYSNGIKFKMDIVESDR